MMDFKKFVTLMHNTAIANGTVATATFSLTARCNLHCKMCFVCNPNISAEELSGEQWLDLMKQACEMGMTFAMLTGGEPLLHKDFWQIYEGLRKMGVFITLNSNGTTITPEIADRLAKMPPMELQITVYGSSPEVYERVTGSAAGYAKAMRGIELLKERGIRISLRTILIKETADDMVNIVNLILSHGVPFSYTNYIMISIAENGNDVISQRLSGKEIAKYTEIINKAIKDYYDTHESHNKDSGESAEKTPKDGDEQNREEHDPSFIELDRQVMEIKSKSFFQCDAGLSKFSVTHNGFINSCIIADEPKIHLKEINFNLKQGVKMIREALSKIKSGPPECINCPDKKDCAVYAPCPAYHFLETGSYDKKADYVCEFTRASVKLLE
jgi:radical SAM protein with 4Fe4S-binding SPASM domain